MKSLQLTFIPVVKYVEGVNFADVDQSECGHEITLDMGVVIFVVLIVNNQIRIKSGSDIWITDGPVTIQSGEAS